MHLRLRGTGSDSIQLSEIKKGKRSVKNCFLLNGGLTYSGVPHIVYALSSTRFAKPKSVSFKYPLMQYETSE